MRQSRPSLPLLLCIIPALGLSALSLSGDGRLQRETRKLPAFTSVSLSGVGSLRVEKTADYSLELYCDGNLLPHYRSEVHQGKLYLGFEDGLSVQGLTKLELRLGLPSLSSLELSGAAQVGLGKGVAAQRLSLEVEGAGSLRAELALRSLTAKISGAGSLDLSGSAEELSCELLGTGRLSASGLRCARASLDISGSGNVELRVRDRLDLDLAGTASIRYWGDPRVNKKVAGLSSIRREGPF